MTFAFNGLDASLYALDSTTIEIWSEPVVGASADDTSTRPAGSGYRLPLEDRLPLAGEEWALQSRKDIVGESYCGYRGPRLTAYLQSQIGVAMNASSTPPRRR